MIYIGTYNQRGSKGIYSLQMDATTGELTPARLAAEASSPNFLAIHPNRRFLYAVGEEEDSSGAQMGMVSAFSIDSGTGDLTFLNSQSSQGDHPCHLVVENTGKCVLTANYTSGSVSCLPILEDGSLGEATSSVQHEGKSVDPQRQEGPHAHSINLDTANRFAVAADLGLDQMLVYRFDAGTGSLTPNDPPYASTAPGAGPRHFAFHPNGRFGYVINELNNSVTAFVYDAEGGVLTVIQEITTLPDDYTDTNWPSEIQIHPSGSFLYGSNRVHDSIAIYSVDSDTGLLKTVEISSTLGKWPRHFQIDPSGQFLLCANQDSDEIAVFRINQDSGQLQDTGHRSSVPMAVCVKFA